jgi:hypothetical protein
MSKLVLRQVCASKNMVSTRTVSSNSDCLLFHKFNGANYCKKWYQLQDTFVTCFRVLLRSRKTTKNNCVRNQTHD